MSLCRCVHPNPTDCLMDRYHASKSFAECMGGCDCACHFIEHGAIVVREDWMRNRYRVARAMRQERHTDPRIEAVMPKEVQP